MTDEIQSAPGVSTLAELDPEQFYEEAVEAGIVDEDTSPEDVGVVVVTAEDQQLVPGILINAYDNLYGAGETGKALTAKAFAERVATLRTDSS